MNINKKTLFGSIIFVILLSSLATSIIVKSVSQTNFTLSSGKYPSLPSFTIWKEGTTYYAKNSFGYISFSSSLFSTVLQNCINTLSYGYGVDSHGGLIIIKQGEYPLTTQVNLTWAGISILGEGIATTLIKASVSMTNMLTKTVGNLTWGVGLFTISDIWFDGDEKVNNIINFNESSVNQLRDIKIERVAVTGYKSYGLIMDGCDETQLIDMRVGSAYAGSKALSFGVADGMVKVIRGFYHGDIESYGQSVLLDSVQIEGSVRATGNTVIFKIINIEMPAYNINSGFFFEVQNGYFVDELVIDGMLGSLQDGDCLISGNFTDHITLKNIHLTVPVGETAYIFANATDLGSKWGAYDDYAEVRLIGGYIFGSSIGDLYVVPSGFIAGVNIIDVDWNFDLGNRVFTESAVGGSLTEKTITLSIAQASVTYSIIVEPHADCYCWITDKTTTNFKLHYSVANGVEVSWYLIPTRHAI